MVSIEMEEDLTSRKNWKSDRGRVKCYQQALQYIVQFGITNEDLCTMPHGVALPVLMALRRCKEIPDLSLPNKALNLIGMEKLKYRFTTSWRCISSPFIEII